MSKLKLPVLGLMSLLGACAHVGMQEVGHGQCSVSGISSSGGYHGSREEAIESAHEYCGRFGKRAARWLSRMRPMLMRTASA